MVSAVKGFHCNISKRDQTINVLQCTCVYHYLGKLSTVHEHNYSHHVCLGEYSSEIWMCASLLADFVVFIRFVQKPNHLKFSGKQGTM